MIYDTYNLDDLPKIVRASTKTLRASQDRFDVIVVTGLSGVTVGVPVSMRLGVPLVVVRKPTESAHTSSHLNFGKLHAEQGKLKRWLFLDDFISSGQTLERCKAAILRTGAQHVGNFLYNRDLKEINWVEPSKATTTTQSPFEIAWPARTYSVTCTPIEKLAA